MIEVEKEIEVGNVVVCVQPWLMLFDEGFIHVQEKFLKNGELAIVVALGKANFENKFLKSAFILTSSGGVGWCLVNNRYDERLKHLRSV